MKKLSEVKSLYNTASFDSAVNKARSFADSGGLLLAQQLQFISPEIFTQQYSGLTFLDQGFVVNNAGGSYTSIVKIKRRIEGDFVESGTATNTTGKITLAAESDTIPVFYLEAESAWSELELKQNETQNINLPNEFMAGHVEKYNRIIDQLGYLGQTRSDGTQKTNGLLNSPWVTNVAVNSAVNLSGQDLYSHISDHINSQRSDVANIASFICTRYVMPTTVYNTALTKILNPGFSNKTVLASLKENFPDITFGSSFKAEDVGGNTVCVAFSVDRNAMQFRVPTPLNISNVYQLGTKYYVSSYFGAAGLDVLENKSASILTGL
jgi:hypothetical protein